MFRYVLKHLSRLRIRHVMEERHRSVEFSLAGRKARDREVDNTKRVLTMVLHLTMCDTRSDNQSDHRHDSDISSVFENHEAPPLNCVCLSD